MLTELHMANVGIIAAVVGGVVVIACSELMGDWSSLPIPFGPANSVHQRYTRQFGAPSSNFAKLLIPNFFRLSQASRNFACLSITY